MDLFSRLLCNPVLARPGPAGVGPSPARPGASQLLCNQTSVSNTTHAPAREGTSPACPRWPGPAWPGGGRSARLQPGPAPWSARPGPAHHQEPRAAPHPAFPRGSTRVRPILLGPRSISESVCNGPRWRPVIGWCGLDPSRVLRRAALRDSAMQWLASGGGADTVVCRIFAWWLAVLV